MKSSKDKQKIRSAERGRSGKDPTGTMKKPGRKEKLFKTRNTICTCRNVVESNQ